MIKIRTIALCSGDEVVLMIPDGLAKHKDLPDVLKSCAEAYQAEMARIEATKTTRTHRQLLQVIEGPQPPDIA